jgi:hypothetical protein
VRNPHFHLLFIPPSPSTCTQSSGPPRMVSEMSTSAQYVSVELTGWYSTMSAWRCVCRNHMMCMCLTHNLMLPKRRFGKAEPTFQNAFPGGSTFKGCEYTIWATNRWKVLPPGNAFWNVGSAFPNLRLGGVNLMLPKRRFGKEEQKMKSIFSTDFSMVRIQNRVLTPLKSASFEIRISPFVPPSQIFVWGA